MLELQERIAHHKNVLRGSREASAPRRIVTCGLFFMRRAGFYFDGFNVYHAIKDLDKPWLKWTCYRRMAEGLLEKDQVIEQVKVFTAVPDHRAGSAQRHRDIILAWEARGATVIQGTFKTWSEKCNKCGHSWPGSEEKESDVNLACHLLSDGLMGKIEVAYVVTSDSDISASVRLLRELAPLVEVVTVSPPNRRHSKEILALADRSAALTPGLLQNCLMPHKVQTKGGEILIPPLYVRQAIS